MPNPILLDLANKLRPKGDGYTRDRGQWVKRIRHYEVARDNCHDDSPEAIEACSWCQAVRELEALG